MKQNCWQQPVLVFHLIGFLGTGSIMHCRQQGHDVRFDSHSVRHLIMIFMITDCSTGNDISVFYEEGL